ncbi:MAG TPA: DUF29 domain-containing protein [Geminicoccaceae bacterium]|nr:DUF29 domain-containing protein [Geminicoccus sp.]HMU52306.1 DUF29 domain-containing protein [Geminicoccaceae bacterium]
MSSLYETDLTAWAEEQAEALRRLATEHPEVAAELDLPNLIDEVESMGASVERELVNRLAVLLLHLAKWQWQPALRTRNWCNTVDEQRDQVALILDDNPSLRHRLPSVLAKAWHLGRRKAHRETGLDLDIFPETCPFSMEQVMQDGWMSDAKE